MYCGASWPTPFWWFSPWLQPLISFFLFALAQRPQVIGESFFFLPVRGGFFLVGVFLDTPIYYFLFHFLRADVEFPVYGPLLSFESALSLM